MAAQSLAGCVERWYSRRMRQHGKRATVSGLGCQDHGCLLYSDDQEFVTQAVAFLREGLFLGQRVMYVGSASPSVMRAQLDGLGDVDDLIRTGALELVSAADVYAVDDLDAAEQGRRYSAAIDRAVEAGYCGLRTLADVTSLLATAGDSAAQVRWEACADRMMSERPWSALCCYDRRLLPVGALTDVAAVHPLDCSAPDLAAFHLFSSARNRMAVSGDVDTFAARDFDRLLGLAAPDQDFELDLSTLDFIDHNGVLAITHRRHHGDAGGRMTVRGASSMATRMAELMGVSL